MAYPAYDGYSRSLSRRPSLGYGTPGYQYGDPYVEPMMPGYGVGEYPQPSYQIYGPPSGGIPMNRLTSPSYEDLAIQDPYYLDERDRAMSVGGPLTPAMSHRSYSGMGMPRVRRHSAVSFASRPQMMDTFRHGIGSIRINFKRKGSFTAGITLGEAQASVRLSGNHSYTKYDLHCDYGGRIFLRVQWAGYSSLTYEIPIESYDGRINLQTLARRVSRATVHYFQAKGIPIPWDRIELHHLEEITYGTWQPMLAAR